MKTYRLGNKVNCIIRASFDGMKIGNQELIENQPYTILKDVEANLTFASKESQGKAVFNALYYEQDVLSEVHISNVELNNKILDLIFSIPKEEEENNPKCHCFINRDSDNQGKVYLDHSETVTDIFVFDENGLNKSIQSWDGSKPLQLAANKNYLIVYSYKGSKKLFLEKSNNAYFTLDLCLLGNKSEDTNDQECNSFIHIEKCALEINKNMYFNKNINAVDLRFKVINDKGNLNSITLE